MERKKKTVLLIEDNYTALMAQTTLLESMNYDVIQASNGTEGIDWANLDSFDILMIDIGLPDISGLDVVQKLRAIPKYTAVKAVAVTADVTQDRRSELLAKGFDQVIEKPLTIEAIEGLA